MSRVGKFTAGAPDLLLPWEGAQIEALLSDYKLQMPTKAHKSKWTCPEVDTWKEKEREEFNCVEQIYRTKA